MGRSWPAILGDRLLIGSAIVAVDGEIIHKGVSSLVKLTVKERYEENTDRVDNR